MPQKASPQPPPGGRYRLALSLTPGQETKLEQVAADWSRENASLETQAGQAREALRGLRPDSPTATTAAQRAVLMKVVAQQVALAQSGRETLAGDLGSDAFASFENHLRAYAPRPGRTLGAAKIQQMKPREECEYVCAYPTNFQQAAQAIATGLVLNFHYTWESSTGDPGDLAGCVIGESVTYSGLAQNGSYPSPPFPPATAPPSSPPSDGSAAGGAMDDQNGFSATAAQFVRPLNNSAVNIYQTYRYKCPCANGGNYVTLATPGNPAGLMTVYQLPNGQWEYSNIKGNLPPASGTAATSSANLILGNQ